MEMTQIHVKGRERKNKVAVPGCIPLSLAASFVAN